MFNIIRADLFKMLHSSIVKILLAITTLAATLMVVLVYLLTEGKLDASYSGIAFLFSDINVISILGAVLAGVFICGDFDNKTIHDAIASGSSRASIVVSKAVVFILGMLVLLLPYAIMTGIALGTGARFEAGSIGVGFLNVLMKTSGTAFSGKEVLKIIVVILTLLLVYIAQMSICVPIALACKKPVIVIAINYAISILNGQLMALEGKSKIFDNIYECTPYGRTYFFLDLGAPAGDIVKAMVVSAAFLILMLILTYGIFRKTEIK